MDNKVVKICKACGKIHNNHGDYCWKHYEQIRKYSKLLDNNSRTQYSNNEVIIQDNYTLVNTYNRNGDIYKQYKIDINDIPLITQYKWSTIYYKKNDSYYLCRKTKDNNIILFHRAIMGFPNESIDHINRDTTDNRKVNLRVANQTEQSLNQKLRKDNILGIKGVYFIDRSKYKKSSGYRAEIKVYNKRYVSQLFNTKEEASYCRYLFTQMYKDFIIPYTDMSWQNILTSEQKESINKYFLNRWKHQV